MNGQLWVEKHRPSKISEYVFAEDRQQQQVFNWISTGNLPHVFFSGEPGTGKCLVGEEYIDVLIDESTLSSDQLNKLANYKR